MKFAVAVFVAAAVAGVNGACHADDGRPADGPLRAVLYEVSRDHNAQNGFVGSVVWHTDQVVSSDEPLPKLAITADVEIPALQVMVKLVLARNDDRSFRASHTVEIMVTLPPAFVHGGVINVPRILLKRTETTPGIPLNNVAVKITPGVFQIGLSNIGTDRQLNIELIKELSWIDLPIVYSDGSRAILGIEKAPLDGRALAVLEPPDVEPPAASPPPRAPTSGPVRPRLNITLPRRPSWVWPPLEWWAVAPRLPSGSWTWQPGWQPVLRETIRLASTTMAASMPGAKLPSWVQDTSRSVVAVSVPPWPRVRAPDFRLPTGPSRFAGEKNLEPPPRFVRWFDQIETVLPASALREVDRRCRVSLGKPPRAGNFYRGCARGVAGRCFITRVDDPGVARHELAHCNGWKHPE
jgi:hypothetical protein